MGKKEGNVKLGMQSWHKCQYCQFVFFVKNTIIFFSFMLQQTISGNHAKEHTNIWKWITIVQVSIVNQIDLLSMPNFPSSLSLHIFKEIRYFFRSWSYFSNIKNMNRSTLVPVAGDWVLPKTYACQSDNLNLTCQEQHVLEVTSANFGRRVSYKLTTSI